MEKGKVHQIYFRRLERRLCPLCLLRSPGICLCQLRFKVRSHFVLFESQISLLQVRPKEGKDETPPEPVHTGITTRICSQFQLQYQSKLPLSASWWRILRSGRPPWRWPWHRGGASCKDVQVQERARQQRRSPGLHLQEQSQLQPHPQPQVLLTLRPSSASASGALEKHLWPSHPLSWSANMSNLIVFSLISELNVEISDAGDCHHRDRLYQQHPPLSYQHVVGGFFGVLSC